MTRVLMVGQEPETVDYSDPALPIGMDAKKIHAGIEHCLKQMTDRGWQADVPTRCRGRSSRGAAARCRDV